MTSILQDHLIAVLTPPENNNTIGWLMVVVVRNGFLVGALLVHFRVLMNVTMLGAVG